MNEIYYVVYEKYSEYNQFEGYWVLDIEEFSDFSKAQKFKDNISKSYNYRKIIGPLTEVEKENSHYCI